MNQFRGKVVSGVRYAHESALSLLPNNERKLIEKLSRSLGTEKIWNVVKLEIKNPKNMSFLAYEDFSKTEFPAILRSYKFIESEQTFKLMRYNAQNPPILHRKELLLPPSHPELEKYSNLTDELVALGAFQNMHRHGTKARWQELLQSLGIVVKNHSVQNVSNTKV